jgi:glycylpeptide N-tetradecanoyltransferase
MTIKDIPKVTKILQEHNEKFKIAPVVNEEFVKKRLLPIHSYVSEMTDDFISFYDIPCERSDGSDVVKQAYRYFMVGDVYNDAFLIAKNLGYHVFNSAEAGVSTELLEKMKFVKGTGYVYYYLFNWHLSEEIEPKEINLILP